MDKIQIKISKKHLVIISMVLMVALVVGMGAMTYAKYTSSYKSDNNTATAAKWGFVVTADSANLFPNDYTLTSGAYATKAANGTGVAVKATNSTLAPGTSGYAVININGVAEVLAKLSITVSVTNQIGYSGATPYYPIKWAIRDAAVADLSTIDNWQTTAQITTSPVVQYIDIDTEVNARDYYLYWCWDFETSTANNRHDTIIGLKASGATLDKVKQVIGDNTFDELDKYSATLTFSINATIEQVQEKPTT